MPDSQDTQQPQVQWDAAQYLRFGGERLRPALDLMLHLPTQAAARILDLGCGAGNLSAILQQRWPRGRGARCGWFRGHVGQGARERAPGPLRRSRSESLGPRA
ncbi:methyltransferase [Herbaspirillum rubrisubalbicans]|uniref:methyltransferase n=1 Tax=Herbaspirillum rubrisubalbicans TaxID=80842 RepID=UPI00344BEB4C